MFASVFIWELWITAAEAEAENNFIFKNTWMQLWSFGYFKIQLCAEPW